MCRHNLNKSVYFAQEIIERDFEKIHQLFEGNIIFSNDVGNSFSHDGDSFRSVASKMFVEPKDVFFVDKSVRCVASHTLYAAENSAWTLTNPCLVDL